MNGYEIRILDKNRDTKMTVHAAHVSDFAAVRSARKLAGSLAVEVWRDLECIYRDQKHHFEHRHQRSLNSEERTSGA